MSTEDQFANVQTKGLSSTAFQSIIGKAGMDNWGVLKNITTSRRHTTIIYSYVSCIAVYIYISRCIFMYIISNL